MKYRIANYVYSETLDAGVDFPNERIIHVFGESKYYNGLYWMKVLLESKDESCSPHLH